MARIALYKDNYADSTVVSNLFIDEYMKDANDAHPVITYTKSKALSEPVIAKITQVFITGTSRGNVIRCV